MEYWRLWYLHNQYGCGWKKNAVKLGQDRQQSWKSRVQTLCRAVTLIRAKAHDWMYCSHWVAISRNASSWGVLSNFSISGMLLPRDHTGLLRWSLNLTRHQKCTLKPSPYWPRSLFWPALRLNNSFCFETVGYSPGYHWSWHSQNEVSLCQWQQFYPHDLVTKDDDKKVNLDASKLHNDSIFGILEDSTSKMAGILCNPGAGQK